MAPKLKIPSFSVNVATLPSSGYALSLRPNGQEREALAKAAGVTALHELEADIVLRRWRRDGVEIKGELRARAEQPCVVTLEPVFQDIREPLRATFLPEHSALAVPVERHDRELVLDPEGDDPPDTFEGDSIDVWPFILEMLMLAIDPFPRAPGAELAPAADDAGEQPESAEESPFAVLRALKPEGK
jgi:uncharacterized metal-binding protein YceD (DUF177 family)